MRILSLSLLVSCSIMSTAACYRTRRMPPPATPSRDVPAVSLEGSPGPGLSRVVLDASDGPAVVERLQGGSLSGVAGTRAFAGSVEVARRVCVTPCVYDAAPGPHELRFTLVGDDARTSVGFINVDTRTSIYRHAIGRHRNKAWKGFVGWPVLALGLLLDAATITVAAKGELDLGNGGHAAMLGVALGTTALGGWLVYGSVVEDQPGAGVQWHPELSASP